MGKYIPENDLVTPLPNGTFLARTHFTVRRAEQSPLSSRLSAIGYNQLAGIDISEVFSRSELGSFDVMKGVIGHSMAFRFNARVYDGVLPDIVAHNKERGLYPITPQYIQYSRRYIRDRSVIKRQIHYTLTMGYPSPGNTTVNALHPSRKLIE